MSRCYLPVSFNEFVVWFRMGAHKVYSAQLIDSYQQAHDLPLDGGLAERIVESMPAHEINAGIVLVALDDPPQQPVGNGSVRLIDFRHIKNVYALTDRGRRFLQDQLGDTFRLSPEQPLDDATVKRLESERNDTLARRGGRALVSMLHGSEDDAEGLEKTSWEEVDAALQCRDRHLAAPIEDGTYLQNLFCYSRSGPIPKTDIGYFFDLGHVLKSAYPRIKPFGYSEALNGWKRDHPNASLYDLYRGLEEDKLVAGFDTNLGNPDSSTMLSSLIFLKLTAILRDTQNFTPNHLQETVGAFTEDRFLAPIAKGLWWCGVYWGFTRFARLFYALSRGELSPLFPRISGGQPASAAIADKAVAVIGERIGPASGEEPETAGDESVQHCAERTAIALDAESTDQDPSPKRPSSPVDATARAADEPSSGDTAPEVKVREAAETEIAPACREHAQSALDLGNQR